MIDAWVVWAWVRTSADFPQPVLRSTKVEAEDYIDAGRVAAAKFAGTSEPPIEVVNVRRVFPSWRGSAER